MKLSLPQNAVQHDNSKDGIVQRPDAKDTPGVETLETPVTLARVVEDSRDEVSSEHEEDVHTDPACHYELVSMLTIEVVKDKDQTYSQCSQAIQAEVTS